MIPPNVLSALGITLTALEESQPIAANLIEQYEIAKAGGPIQGIFSRFMGLYFQEVANPSRAGAQAAYLRARAWANMGETLVLFPGDVPFDPRLAVPVASSKRFVQEYGGVQVTVLVTITDPATGQQAFRRVRVADPLMMTRDLANSEALAAVEEMLGTTPILGDRESLEGLDISYSYENFMIHS